MAYDAAVAFPQQVIAFLVFASVIIAGLIAIKRGNKRHPPDQSSSEPPKSWKDYHPEA